MGGGGGGGGAGGLIPEPIVSVLLGQLCDVL